MKEDHKSIDNTTGEAFTEGEESYIEDDESYMERLEGSSSSFQDDYAESLEGNYSFSISDCPCFNSCKSIK